jgi:hypothetical protein
MIMYKNSSRYLAGHNLEYCNFPTSRDWVLFEGWANLLELGDRERDPLLQKRGEAVERGRLHFFLFPLIRVSGPFLLLEQLIQLLVRLVFGAGGL